MMQRRSCLKSRKTGVNGNGKPEGNGDSVIYEKITSDWAKTWLPVISLIISIIVLLKS